MAGDRGAFWGIALLQNGGGRGNKLRPILRQEALFSQLETAARRVDFRLGRYGKNIFRYPVYAQSDCMRLL